MKKKNDLRKDTVKSDGFHVGIELELIVSGAEGHDDDACYQSARENHELSLNELSTKDLIMDYIGLERRDASSVEPYFDRDQFISDQLSNFEHRCDDSDCPYDSGENIKREIESDLRSITGNTSFKVVHDGSLDCDGDETSAEVCWNFFASKDTIKDNDKIMQYLKKVNGVRFDTSCGLHINLNNYLKINNAIKIPTEKLDFLFNFVAPSRESSTYCNQYGMSGTDKYSMIFNQGDRLEFRFFSPTLESIKLHHYIVLANTVYRRLAGQNVRLPKRTERYLINKMTTTNKLDLNVAQDTINQVNSLASATDLIRQPSSNNNVMKEYVDSVVRDSILYINTPVLPIAYPPKSTNG